MVASNAVLLLLATTTVEDLVGARKAEVPRMAVADKRTKHFMLFVAASAGSGKDKDIGFWILCLCHRHLDRSLDRSSRRGSRSPLKQDTYDFFLDD